MTETPTPRTFKLTTSPRKGDKLAITVTTSDGLKVTKVTARTYPFIVVTFGVWPSRYDRKLGRYVHDLHADVQVTKGTGNRKVAEREYDRCSGAHARALLSVGGPSGYRIEKASSSVVREVAA